MQMPSAIQGNRFAGRPRCEEQQVQEERLVSERKGGERNQAGLNC
jgi:hypothetical protein